MAAQATEVLDAARETAQKVASLQRGDRVPTSAAATAIDQFTQQQRRLADLAKSAGKRAKAAIAEAKADIGVMHGELARAVSAGLGLGVRGETHLYEVPRWDVFLHRLARGLDAAHDGDEAGRLFEDELFERVFDGEMQLLPDADRDARLAPWASKIHEACQQLPAFERLAAECRGDADAAGAAVEKLVDELKNLTADSELGAVRSGMRAAATAASRAVDELREAIAGLENVATGAASLGRRLRDDARLRRIAVLAGRFKRIAATKRRHRARRGADEISDLELGADLGRIFRPSWRACASRSSAWPCFATSPSAGACSTS